MFVFKCWYMYLLCGQQSHQLGCVIIKELTNQSNDVCRHSKWVQCSDRLFKPEVPEVEQVTERRAAARAVGFAPPSAAPWDCCPWP